MPSAMQSETKVAEGIIAAREKRDAMIVKRLQEDDDLSYYRLAKELKLHPSTVSRVGRKHGVNRMQNSGQAAMAAKVADFSKEKRLDILNQMFTKLGELIEASDSGKDFKDLAIAVGILIDKRRLEDGESTSREEHVGLNFGVTRHIIHDERACGVADDFIGQLPQDVIIESGRVRVSDK